VTPGIHDGALPQPRRDNPRISVGITRPTTQARPCGQRAQRGLTAVLIGRIDSATPRDDHMASSGGPPGSINNGPAVAARVASGERHSVDFEPCPIHQGYRATAVAQLRPSVTSITGRCPPGALNGSPRSSSPGTRSPATSCPTAGHCTAPPLSSCPGCAAPTSRPTYTRLHPAWQGSGTCAGAPPSSNASAKSSTDTSAAPASTSSPRTNPNGRHRRPRPCGPTRRSGGPSPRAGSWRCPSTGTPTTPPLSRPTSHGARSARRTTSSVGPSPDRA
jgi:hypothetical protein